MTRVLSLPTEHREVAAAVDSIATQIAESTVRAAAPEEVGGGEWVRFRWLLADGTPFFEGTGRCEACRPAASGRYDVVLSALSFDARNEAMFERILLSSAQGPRTGKHAPVPKIAKANGASEAPPAKAAPVNGASSAPRPIPRKPPPPPPAKLSEVVRSTLSAKATPPELAKSAVSPELAERARKLARRLNLSAPALAHGRWTEQRVIDAALRMGIESLEALLAAHKEE